jgi:hypothetical protein
MNTKGFTVGFELEVNNSNRAMYAPDEVREYFEAKEDGSLGDDGVEFVSIPTNNDETHKAIKIVTDYFNKNGYSVDDRCGFHVHLAKKGREFNDLDVKKILIAYSVFKESLFRMVAKERYHNSYCSPKKIDLYPEFLSTKVKLKRYLPDTLNSRYTFINFDSLTQHGTIEIRMHSGTTNREKIENWIRININLFHFALSSTIPQLLSLKGDSKTFSEKVLCSPKLKYYYLKRVSQTRQSVYETGKSGYDLLFDNFARVTGLTRTVPKTFYPSIGYGNTTFRVSTVPHLQKAIKERMKAVC